MKSRPYRTTLVVLALLLSLSAVASPALAGAGAQTQAQADLLVEQPRHVSSQVGQTTENNTRIYVARGQYLELTPRNFNQSDVTTFSVQESEAILSYDKADREYVLNTQGHTGTYHLAWTVSTNNSTTVYTAVIRVTVADYAHLPGEQYQELRNQSTRGDEIVSTLEDAGDPDEPLEQKLAFAVKVLDFAANPFSAFTGQFMALQTMRFLTPAGWVDLALILLVFWMGTRGAFAAIARYRRQMASEEEISRREDRQYIQMFKGVLAGEQLSDIPSLDDHQTAVLEERLGTNLHTVTENFLQVWGPTSLKRMYLDAMHTVGYAARVHRDDAGSITDVEVTEDAAMADGGEDTRVEHVALDSAPRDVVDAIGWDQVDRRVFQKNPDISAVDHLMVANREGDRDLISELNIQIPEDFQSRQAMMEAIGHIIRHLMESDYTDEETIPREDRAILNNIMAFTTTLDQAYQIPMDLYWRACVWNAENLHRDDEARSVLEDITDSTPDIPGLETPNGGEGGD